VRLSPVVYWNPGNETMEGLMNRKHLAMSTLLAALLSAAGASSFAQDRYHGDRDGRGNDGQYSRRDNDRSDRSDRRTGNRYDRHRDDQRDGYQARGGERYGGDRRWDGAGPNHDLRRGGRLPSRYRNHQYVVDNWREHHLRPPPRGYHWVQTGGDYVLAAIATGVIADLIINH
jgi:Ni/Co efflux regulator RcnB